MKEQKEGEEGSLLLFPTESRNVSVQAQTLSVGRQDSLGLAEGRRNHGRLPAGA